MGVEIGRTTKEIMTEEIQKIKEHKRLVEEARAEFLREFTPQVEAGRFLRGDWGRAEELAWRWFLKGKGL